MAELTAGFETGVHGNGVLTSAVTVATTSSQTINGVTTYSLATQYKYVTVESDGANWLVVGNN